MTRRLHKFGAKRDEDFTLWTLRFEALLESKDLLSIVESDPFRGNLFSELEPELKRNINKTKMLLVQSLGDKPLRTIIGEKKNPFVMYEKLQKRYTSQNAATHFQLQTELHQKVYSVEVTMSEYIDGLESIFNRLEAMDSGVSDSMQVAILLASFGSTYESPYGAVVTALQTMSDDELTWETATARLLQEYSTRDAIKKKG